MNKIDYKKLCADTQSLYHEYQKEGEEKYKKLFNKYFHDIENFTVYSFPFRLMGCVHDICIVIDRYPKVRIFVCAPFDMEPYALSLRKDPLIREFTKLCMYIEEKIPPFDGIDLNEGDNIPVHSL